MKKEKMRVLSKTLRRDNIITINMLKSQPGLALVVPDEQTKKEYIDEFNLPGETWPRIICFADITMEETDFKKYDSVIIQRADELLSLLMGRVKISAIVL